jgi:hypothetical protein
MLKSFSLVIILSSFIWAQNFDFTLIKKGDANSTNRLLVVGGIQGDEPGGFMAASLLSTHYEITKGSVWIVPNFNFYSIIKRSRGPNGDLNRKFNKLPKDDPDYALVQRMKEIIQDKSVKMVVNLHDGSGFYRQKYIDKWHQPLRWGQATIIDQIKIDGIAYGNLQEIANEVDMHINKHLLAKEHIFHTKNTKTYLKKTFEEKEMSKTLTYFAINEGKAAFGNESSKALPVNERVYYKLLALEKFMDIMGIQYKRKFPLTARAVKQVIDNDIYISFNNKKIFIPLSRIRPHINYFPVKKGDMIAFQPSSPVMTVLHEDDKYVVYYGNRRLTTLNPEYLDYEKNPSSVNIIIDGKKKKISFGSLIFVKNYFNVLPNNSIRVNVIGYVNKKHENESGLNIRQRYFLKRFSIDKDAKRFRVEFYDSNNKKKFLGMILVEFTK